VAHPDGNRLAGMISLHHVRKVFAGSKAPAVDDLSFDIPDGEIVTLIGPSGCGKSTTLRMINRLIEPTSGSITIDGVDVRAQAPHALRRGIGYVIQQVGLFPHRTVAQNVATVPELLGWDKARTRTRVAGLLELVGLDAALGARYPHELSGGQQQRAGVARALAADPPVLLMDEPFGAVDPIVRARLQGELLNLQTELRKTIVFVTHDLDEAIRLGDRMAILNVGGVLEQYGTPGDVLAEPANDFVTSFLGSERGLKRLSLVPVSAVQLDPGPTLAPGATVAEARTLMAERSLDWVAIVEDGKLRGWVAERALDGHARVGDASIQRFVVTLQPTDSLREALDTLVGSPTHIAPVVDENDNYLGTLDVARIGEGLDR
jgi:osmoprotectant transport system ATP-binding protein